MSELTGEKPPEKSPSELPATPSAQVSPPGGKKALVLILEDNPANLKYMSYLASKLQVGCITAESGEKALELLKNYMVDCMLVDISLAIGMSGVEFMRRVKRQDKFKDVRMVAVTAHAMRGQKEEFLREGFDDYLAKPFLIKDLQAVLDRNLPKKDPP